MNHRSTGDEGEDLACEYLVKKGFIILERNYEIPFGEIDIIARKKWGLLNFLRGKNERTIHFVEVKTLSFRNPSFSPEQRVDYKKQQKLRRMAEIWLTKNKFPQSYPYQIDIISVILAPTPKIYFFENAVPDITKPI